MTAKILTKLRDISQKYVFPRFASEELEGRFRDQLFDAHFKFLKCATTLGMLMMLSFSVFDLFSGEAGVAATRARFMIHAPLLLIALVGFSIFANKDNWQAFVIAIAAISESTAMHIVVILDGQRYFGISSAAGAFNTSAIAIFMLSVFPLNALYGAIVCVLIIFIYSIVYFSFSDVNTIVYLSYLANLMAIVLTGILLCAWRDILLRGNFYKQVKIDEERKSAETILYHMVPSRVVDRLKNGESPISEAHSEVCVTFADIVNFSAISQEISPQLLVEALNSLFERFAQEARACGVEHFKSIGDAFMAVEIRESERVNTGKNSLDLALSMVSHAKSFSDQYGIEIRLRVGVHSGFSVGGVMEAISPFYDFWGTTVNIASRLEEAGEIDRVQVSEAVRARYGIAYEFERRGEVDLKGHGRHVTYWLLRRKPQQA